MSPMESGCLYVIATPIGNLEDITKRAVTTLKQVDLIAAEDTRHSRKLLACLQIKARLFALHEHNERDQCGHLVARMCRGQCIALISDAGTPMISDPGYHLVRAAQDAGIRVLPIPGPSALISALSVTGVAANRFYFHGFLPVKKAARREYLYRLRGFPETIVFYEAGRRMLATLGDMDEIFGSEREVGIAREMTKQYETIVRDRLGNLLVAMQDGQLISRGEFVLLVGSQMPLLADVDNQLVHRLIQELGDVLSPGKLASVIANVTHLPRKQAYQMLLDKQSAT